MNASVYKVATSVAAVITGFASFAPAAVIYLRDNTTAYAGNPVTQTTFDDATTSVTSGVGSATNAGTSSSLQMRTTSAGVVDRSLIALKNLFTLVPATSGGDSIQINSATLHLFANSTFGGDANSTVNVYRVTTNWVTAAAGGNETEVSGKYTKNSTLSPWATGVSGGLTASDFTTTNGASITWTASSNFDNAFNVTGIVTDIYSTGNNYGFVTTTTSTNPLQARSSEQTETITPVLVIDYSYVPEPTTLGFLGLAVMGLTRRRRL